MWKRWLKWCGKAVVQYAPKIAEIIMEIVVKKKKDDPPNAKGVA
jgi:hypothetical protein